MTDNRTTEQTAMKHLRALLDERGVEHYDGTESTLWLKDEHGYRASADELSSGRLSVHVWCDTPEQAIAATLGSEINGDTSDGYHTFNELYHHRAVLFSVIVRDHRELAWKARKHHDGTMYDGMFIVGIETPKGQATYHYDLDPYWEMFDCEERKYAPEWDGHTPDEAIARIAELGSGTCEPNWTLQGKTQTHWRCECSNCGECFGVETKESFPLKITVNKVDVPNYCPNCGRQVRKEMEHE